MISHSRFFSVILILSLIKLWLISDLGLYVNCGNIHDEKLFLDKGISLSEFEWLGDYNNLTLAKGPFYPIFLALNYFIGIPLLISEAILYLCACLLVVLVIRKKVNNDYAVLFLFVLLAFNPITYTLELRKVIREGIYPALGVLTIFSFFKAYLTDSENFLYKQKWIWISGIVLSYFWLTKEDGIWIMPSLVLICIYFLLNNYFKKRKVSFKPLLFASAPFLILFAVINLFSTINLFMYNSYNAVDFNNKQFVRAYASLVRVKTDSPLPYIPVTKETRNYLFKEIPSFGELKETEVSVFQAWSAYHPYCESFPKTCGETAGGWFVWALRDAVAAKGYYKDGKTAEDYYRRLADEINAACDCGKLDCYPESNSMLPPLNKSHIESFSKEFLNVWQFVIHFKNFSVSEAESNGSEREKFIVEKFTGNRLANKLWEKDDVKYPMSKIKRKILGGIGFFYRIVTPIFFYISLLCIPIIIFILIKGRSINARTVIIFSLLAAVVSRIVILTLVHITSFPAVRNSYLSPVHPLLLAFIFLAMFEVYHLLKNRKINDEKLKAI